MIKYTLDGKDIKLDTTEKRLMNLKIYEKKISKMKHKEKKKD